jgi:hypothetical protein
VFEASAPIAVSWRFWHALRGQNLSEIKSSCDTDDIHFGNIIWSRCEGGRAGRQGEEHLICIAFGGGLDLEAYWGEVERLACIEGTDVVRGEEDVQHLV